jgi:hypothetical protein
MWILFASLAVIVAATYLGFDLRTWFRSAPLRREWKARAVTFRTELDWVRCMDCPCRRRCHPEIGWPGPARPTLT